MLSQSFKIAIVDEHPLFAEAFSQRIDQTDGMTVVYTAQDSEQGFRSALTYQPDLVLMSVDIPGRGAFTLSDELSRRLPAARQIFLSDYVSDVFLDEALRRGAAGYLLTSDSTDRLIASIQSACQGGTAFSDAVMERLEYDPATKTYSVKVTSYLATLTSRQTEVLRHLVRGESVKEVSRTMALSERAIESHKYRIMRKLGIHDRVELARYAIREGLAIP